MGSAPGTIYTLYLYLYTYIHPYTYSIQEWGVFSGFSSTHQWASHPVPARFSLLKVVLHQQHPSQLQPPSVDHLPRRAIRSLGHGLGEPRGASNVPLKWRVPKLLDLERSLRFGISRVKGRHQRSHLFVLRLGKTRNPIPPNAPHTSFGALQVFTTSPVGTENETRTHGTGVNLSTRHRRGSVWNQ